MLFDNRKIYLINKDFQWRFILRFVSLATLWAVMTVMLIAYLAGKRLDSIRYSSSIDIKTMSELLLPIMVGAQAISLLIFAGILAYTIRALWRRLSSPLYSIKKDISRIAGGDLTCEVCLCNTEEFQGLAADLDVMRRGLRDRMVRIKEQQKALSHAAVELNRSILEGNPLLSHALSVRSVVERIQEEVQAFQY